VARNLGNCRQLQARKDANDKRHIPAWLFDVFGERVLIVVDGVLVSRSVVVPVSDDMTVTVIMMMGENKTEIVVAGVSGRRFRCSDKYTLHGKGYRGCHHDDGGQTL